MYRLFSWEHSYFSGKARAYLRYKERMGDLNTGFEDILATPELMMGLLTPATGSPAVPQVLAPDGSWVQDTSEIIDYLERRHTQVPVIPSLRDSPRQAIASYLIEVLADEWLVVPGFWERWHYSLEGVEPSHLAFNEQQWGAVFAAGARGSERRAAGQSLFEQGFGISEARTNPKGVYAGLVHLGVSPETESAWWASLENVLDRLDAHLDRHDFALGGRPSLADFGLMGPLYAHVFRDATSGFMLRTRHPLVAEWVERTNGTNSLNARSYGQKLYSLGDGGELVARPATSDGGQWLTDDTVPETLDALVAVFFDEMWPVMKSTMERTAAFIASGAHEAGGQLPGKTFFADLPWLEHQTGDGALTHEFEIGGVRARRMVAPIQIWKLQRIASAIDEATATDAGRVSVEAWLDGFAEGRELLELKQRLRGCRVRKEGARLFSEP
jgi:glutathione S-transferase